MAAEPRWADPRTGEPLPTPTHLVEAFEQSRGVDLTGAEYATLLRALSTENAEQ